MGHSGPSGRLPPGTTRATAPDAAGEADDDGVAAPTARCVGSGCGVDSGAELRRDPLVDPGFAVDLAEGAGSRVDAGVGFGVAPALPDEAGVDLGVVSAVGFGVAFCGGGVVRGVAVGAGFAVGGGVGLTVGFGVGGAVGGTVDGFGLP